MMQNWAAIKSHSLLVNHGFISFKKNIKKAIEEMKEESIQVSVFESRSVLLNIEHPLLCIDLADFLPGSS